MTLIGTFRVFPTLFFNGTPSYRGPPDQTGKVVAITGGGSGIGFEVSKAMLAANAKVYVMARSSDKALKAITSLKEETGKDNIHFIKLDLASLQSVKAAAEEFLSKEPTLHVLFNNAGVMASNPGEKTVEGFELQAGTNVLGHHVLTSYLLPALKKAAEESPEGISRVISTGSFVQWMARGGEMNFKYLENGGPKGISSWDLYCRSKVGTSLWANAMGRRHTEKDDIVFATVNPGLIKTDALIGLKEFGPSLLGRMIGHPIASGAVSILYAGTSPDITKADTGSYYVPWCKKGVPINATLDTTQQDRLYKVLQDFTVKILGSV